MLKVKGSAMPGALCLLPFAVYASEAAGGGEPDAPASSPLNRDELSLYSAPGQKLRYVEPEPGQLENSLATLRKSAEPYAVWCQGTYAKIQPRVRKVVQLGGDAYDYLRNPPKDFYPRAGIIGFTGVLGLFLARGSRIKRLVYPTSLVAVSTSLYYPEQAAAIAKSAGDSVYESAVRSYAAAEKVLKPKGKKAADSETKP
ncbi:unnamed protein product [Menidia menidia]|uniref:MICOS complex subunit n=1 Tax=Menidia menidia TaxID=238744 RepID=A0A8S4AWT5_9TELE|nr:unnamed protein product [Menidia menidia]